MFISFAKLLDFGPNVFPPYEKSVDKLLFLFHISRPVSLDMFIKLILQRVAAIFRIQFTNLENKNSH